MNITEQNFVLSGNKNVTDVQWMATFYLSCDTQKMQGLFLTKMLRIPIIESHRNHALA